MLPPREGFSPDAAGAIGLAVRLLARPGDVVVGRAVAHPFEGPLFLAAAADRWPGSSLGRYARGVARTLRAVAPARIEVHNRPAVALALARRFPAVPVSLHLHNDPLAMRGTTRSGARARLARRIAVAAVSSHLADRWCTGGRAIPPPEILPNALDLSALPASLDPAMRERLILFAGRIVADKGADLFVDAVGGVLADAPSWRAAMIGADRFSADSPETPFLASLRPRAATAAIALEGYRPHAAVLDAMARAAIVVVPSRWEEPFGLVALEAMANGAALVATRRGGLPEVVGDAALLVPHDDAEALADAVRSLVVDPDRRAALAARGRARAALFDAPAARARLNAFRARGRPA